jgi:hypothetical protein
MADTLTRTAVEVAAPVRRTRTLTDVRTSMPRLAWWVVCLCLAVVSAVQMLLLRNTDHG